MKLRKEIRNAAIIAAATICTYPFLNSLATLERGHADIGGEEVILAAGIIIPIMMIANGYQRWSQRKGGTHTNMNTADNTESEESILSECLSAECIIAQVE
jgi:hypothetical protein